MADQSNPGSEESVALGTWMCRLLTGRGGTAVSGFAQNTFFSCVSQTFQLKGCRSGIELITESLP
ncbi:hypothetical protein CHS0354_014702, partial [Potamilus streckersoni]